MRLNETHIHSAHLITLNFCSMSPELKNPQKNQSQHTKKKQLGKRLRKTVSSTGLE